MKSNPWRNPKHIKDSSKIFMKYGVGDKLGAKSVELFV